jgi:carbonic anhydrase
MVVTRHIGLCGKQDQMTLTRIAVAPIFDNLPNDLDTHHHLVDPFNPAAFLPASTSHYRYVGSLTTAPCTEGVQWLVMTERIHFNARPVQRRF